MTGRLPVVLRLALVIALVPGCAAGSSVPGEAPPRPRGPTRAAPAASATAPAASSPAAPPIPAPSVTGSALVVDGLPAPSASPTAGEADPPAAPSSTPAPAPPLGPAERAVLRAVESNATVRALCASSAAQGGPCLVYVDQPGVGRCPPGLALLHPCLWTVAVASNMGTHASRRATMLVRPDGVVVAAANLFCPPMRPADWARVERASLAGTPVDDCPPAVADAPGAPPTHP